MLVTLQEKALILKERINQLDKKVIQKFNPARKIENENWIKRCEEALQDIKESINKRTELYEKQEQEEKK